jgi:hypothetical protein
MTYEERQAEIKRIRDENHVILATPTLFDGDISPMQVGMMSDRQRKEWQEKCGQKISLEAKIRTLSRTDAEIASDEKWILDRDKAALRNQLENRIEWLTHVGTYAGGKISKKYQREIDKAKTELETL